ncbi:MAG: ComEC/Rec2 family competence protein, partial [Terriglobales bacterium]
RLLRGVSYDLHVLPAVAQFRIDVRMIAGRMRRFVGDRLGFGLPVFLLRVAIRAGELIFISALMQAGLALLMAYHFHRATTMGMPANLAVIPLTQVLMPFAAAAVGLGYISTTLAKPAVWISGMALEGIAGTVHFFGGAQLGSAHLGGARLAGAWSYACRRFRFCRIAVWRCGLDRVCSFAAASSGGRNGDDDH